MQSTKERLIEATFQEVYSKGYNAASLSTILKAADVKKGAMYHHFSSKKEMVLAMIEQKVQQRIYNYWKDLETQQENIIEFIVSILKDTSNRDFKRGCPLGNLLQETLIDDKDFALVLKNIIEQWQALFESSLQKALELQEIKNVNVQELALFIIATLEGAILLSKNSCSSYEYDKCINHLENYLYSFKVHS